MFAKAVRDERVEVDLLLTDEAAARELPSNKQIEDRAHRRGGRNLNRAPRPSAKFLVVHLAPVGNLHELPAAGSDDGAERHDDVLKRDRHRTLENLFQLLTALAKPQLLEQKLHRLRVPHVPNRLVVHFAYPSGERLA